MCHRKVRLRRKTRSAWGAARDSWHSIDPLPAARGRRRGAVLAECALVLPCLLLITLATFEFFQALLITDLLQVATREGAREAALMSAAGASESLTGEERRVAEEAQIRAVIAQRLEAFGLRVNGSAAGDGVATDGTTPGTRSLETILRVEIWITDGGEAAAGTPSLAPAGSAVGVRASLTYDDLAWLPAPRWLMGRTLTAASMFRRE